MKDGQQEWSSVHLNFGACLQEACQSFGQEYSCYVCNYNQLRKCIPTENSDNSNSLSNIVSNFGKLGGALAGMHVNPGTGAKFIAALDAELRRVESLMTSFFDELVLELYDEYHHLRTFVGDHHDMTSLKKHHNMELIGERLRCFDHFRKWNMYSFRRLAMKFDEFIQKTLVKEKHATSAWVDQRLKETLNHLNLEGGLILYSMCHHLRRQHLGRKSSESLSVNIIERIEIDGSNFDTGSIPITDEHELLNLAKETGIKLGPAIERSFGVNQAEGSSDKQPSKQASTLRTTATTAPSGRVTTTTGEDDSHSPPNSPDADQYGDNHLFVSRSLGPLGGPSLAPPLEFDDIEDDDMSSVHGSFEETTSVDKSASDISVSCGLEEVPLSSRIEDSTVAADTACVGVESPVFRESIEDDVTTRPMSVEDCSIVASEQNDATYEKKVHCRTTRRLLVPPDDNMSVKVVLCRYLAMLNFAGELQILRYYKLLLTLHEKGVAEGHIDQGSSLSNALIKSRGMAKFLPSKSLANCTEKKRNIYMAFLDSNNLQGYQDLLSDSDYRSKIRHRTGDAEHLVPPTDGPEGVGLGGGVATSTIENLNVNNFVETTTEESRLVCRKKKFRDKARLWRLRWSDEWCYQSQKMVLVERIDYADADSKSRSASGQSAYADCPGGTFRDPSCPGSGESSIPTIEEVVEEGVFGVALEARDLQRLLSDPESFDLIRCAEYYATNHCFRLEKEVVISHFMRVMEALRKVVVQYGIRPVLQTWSKRDMFVFTDPNRERNIPPTPPDELKLTNRTEWSHAADITSSTLVMVDEDIAYVDQFNTYFDYSSNHSPPKISQMAEPIVCGSDAYKKGLTWNFPSLVVRIHGREERCSAVASLINNTSLRAAEVYGLSSYAHGIAQLVAPKINALRGGSAEPLRYPSWMSFTEMIQTAEANLFRQMKDQKTILRQSRRSTGADGSDLVANGDTSLTDRSPQTRDITDQVSRASTSSSSPQPHAAAEEEDEEVLNDTHQVQQRPTWSTAYTSPSETLSTLVQNESVPSTKTNANKSIPTKILDIFHVPKPKIDKLDHDLWTDMVSCRAEIRNEFSVNDQRFEADLMSPTPTIVAAFDSTINNLTRPLVSQPRRINRDSWFQSIMEPFTSVFQRKPQDDEREQSVQTHIVRVEPKAYFANERTLLQWMNICVLLSTISVTLLSLDSPTASVAGVCLAPIAIFFLIYSYSVYTKRNKALTNREPIKYSDELGPFLLVCSLVVALSIILVANVRNRNDMNQFKPTFKKLSPR
eukprot:GHVH01003902.1.p1 GENE.GHVH01003902.1~~GHVH01003902.1.p1  ORF type:complete len:1282 (+),score=173.57 GHVH01003902.1:208-4053(+)